MPSMFTTDPLTPCVPASPAFDASHVAVVSSLVGTLAAGCSILFRLGFGTQASPTLRLLGGAYFLLFFPLVLKRRAKERRPPLRWTASQASALLVTLAGMMATGWLLRWVPVNLSWVVAGAGGMLAAVEWRRFLKVLGIVRCLGLLAGAVVFVMWAFPTYHLGRDPLFLENLQVTGDTSIDAWFHASLAHIIETYGAVSNGLDGLLFSNYHFGSHWLFAQLSALLNVSPLQFYLIGFQALIVPLFINSLGTFVIEMRRRLGVGATLAWPWVAFGVATIGYTYLDSISVTRNETITQSESLTVSIIVMCITATLTLHAFDDFRGTPIRPRRRDYVFWFALLPALIGASGLAKISTMVLVVATLGYLFLRLRLYRERLFVLAAAISMAAAIGVSSIFVNSASQMPFVPFDYLIHFAMSSTAFSPPVKLALFVVCRFLGLWTLAALVFVRFHGTRASSGNGSARLALEVTALVAILGAAPGFIWAMPAGAAGYFLAVQTWVALAFVMACGGARAIDGGAPKPTVNRFRQFAMTLMGVAVCASLAHLAIGPFAALLGQNGAIRTSVLLTDPGNDRIVSVFPHDFDAAIENRQWTTAGQLVRGRWLLRDGSGAVEAHAVQIVPQLQRMAALPRSIKRNALLFIPRRNHLFWGVRQRNHLANNVTAAELPNFLDGGGGLNLSCDIMPFLAPAMTGIAMIDGLPGKGCQANYYNYNDYYLARGNAPLFTDDVRDAYRRAVAQGFSRLIVFDEVDGQPTITIVDR